MIFGAGVIPTLPGSVTCGYHTTPASGPLQMGLGTTGVLPPCGGATINYVPSTRVEKGYPATGLVFTRAAGDLFAPRPRLDEPLHFDIQSTGQKSHCVNINL